MRGSSIRVRLLLLVLAATLPVLLFSAALLFRAFQGGAALIEQNVMSGVRQISLALDDQISRAQSITRALAESPLMEQADPAAFASTVARALADVFVALLEELELAVEHVLALGHSSLVALHFFATSANLDLEVFSELDQLLFSRHHRAAGR